MKAYLPVLRIADYRLLWIGLVLNLLGDGATFAALAWITVNKAGAAGLATLAVCITIPVIVGGAVIGPLLDRFSRRKLFIYDSVFRGLVVAGIPLLAWLDALALWHLYAVALIYGLLKIIPMAGVPAVIPELVPAADLQAASGLEATAMGAANVGGPAIGAALIAWIGASNVLLLDAVTYFVFAVLIVLVKAPLNRPEPDGPDAADQRLGWGPVFRMLVRDRFLLFLTLSFAAGNVAAGSLLVTLPWLAKFEFSSNLGVLGLLLAMVAAGELAGSLVSGAMKISERHQMFLIGMLQLVASCALFLLLPRDLPWIVTGLLLNGLLAGPAVVLGTVVRLTRIPNSLRGRAMTLMRTIMAGALPVGSAVGGLFLAGGHYTALVLIVAVLAAGPGLLTALSFRRTSFKEGVTVNAEATAAH